MHPVSLDSFLNELGEIGYQKEVGVRSVLRQLSRTRRIVRKIRRGVAKVPDAVEDVSRKAYVKSPEWVQKAHDKALELAHNDPEGVAGYVGPIIRKIGGG